MAAAELYLLAPLCPLIAWNRLILNLFLDWEDSLWRPPTPRTCFAAGNTVKHTEESWPVTSSALQIVEPVCWGS